MPEVPAQDAIHLVYHSNRDMMGIFEITRRNCAIANIFVCQPFISESAGSCSATSFILLRCIGSGVRSISAVVISEMNGSKLSIRSKRIL